MRRLDVVWLPDAVLDLQDIYRYVYEASRHHPTAERFVRRIMERGARIGDAPHGGRSRDDLAPGLRIVPFEKSAVIAYRVLDTVEIVNIFYGGRDYEALFRNDES